MYPTTALIPAPIPAHPVTLTLGCDHADADQQEEAEAQQEQEGAGSGAEMLQEGLGRRRPCRRRAGQDKEFQRRRETGEEEGATGTCQGWRWCTQGKLGGGWTGRIVGSGMPRPLTPHEPAQVLSHTGTSHFWGHLTLPGTHAHRNTQTRDDGIRTEGGGRRT